MILVIYDEFFSLMSSVMYCYYAAGITRGLHSGVMKSVWFRKQSPSLVAVVEQDSGEARR